jgi:hypothetical protein
MEVSHGFSLGRLLRRPGEANFANARQHNGRIHRCLAWSVTFITSRQIGYSSADLFLSFVVNQKTPDEINEELADCELVQGELRYSSVLT